MIGHSKALIILVIKKLKGLNYFSYKKKTSGENLIPP